MNRWDWCENVHSRRTNEKYYPCRLRTVKATGVDRGRDGRIYPSPQYLRWGMACIIITPPPLIFIGWMSYRQNIWSTNKNNERNSRLGIRKCENLPRSLRSLHRCTGPFPFGGTAFFARISHLCPIVEYVWAMHFCRTWGGGGGATLWSDWYGTPQRGRVWEGVSASHGGDFFLLVICNHILFFVLLEIILRWI